MYREIFIESLRDLKKNPILFLPDIIIFLVNMMLGLLFLKYSGILNFLTDAELLAKELESMVPIIKIFLQENLLKIIITLALFILTSFVIGAGLIAMKLGMMKELIKGRKLTIRKMMNKGRFVWQVVSMKMLMFVIGIVTLLFTVGTGIILSTFIQKEIAIIIMGAFFPIFVIFLQLLLFFRYQVMFLEDKHTIVAIKESFEYFLKNKKHVFIVWLIISIVSFLTTPLSAFMGLGEQKVLMLSTTVAIGYFLTNIIKILVNVWSEMFKFRNYKA